MSSSGTRRAPLHRPAPRPAPALLPAAPTLASRALRQVTLNKVAWCVITLCCMRPSDKEREREVLATTKLKKDVVTDKSKTGVNIGAALATAVAGADVPVGTIDYCCMDTTSSNSSLNLPRDKGGSGGEGGAYAHLWACVHAARTRAPPARSEHLPSRQVLP